MILENFILPYPYKAFDYYNRITNYSFESYKEKIYKWVKDNSHEKEHMIIENINSCFHYVKNEEYYNEIRDWMISHKDKLKYFSDFSGIDFGIRFFEESETIGICRPCFISDEDKVLYPHYNEDEFTDKSMIDKLNWMYDYCEFIPFRMMYECVNDNESHKYSHILKDKQVCDKLSDYIKSSPFPPNKDVYYYIWFDNNKKKWYLKRDLEKSPKTKWL